MKLRTIAAGLILALAITPAAAAAPKTAPAPAPVSGGASTVEPQFFCLIWPSMSICHPR